MKLTASDESMLAGAAGEGAALAMRIVVGAAHALGAEALLDISSASLQECVNSAVAARFEVGGEGPDET